MVDQQPTQAEAIPQTLSHLMQLNERYGVLICLNEKCCCAVSPSAMSGYLRRKHKTPIELRKQVDRYIKEFPFQYDYSTVNLPIDGLAPQPVVEVLDGFQCKHCQNEPLGPYKTQDRSNARKHGNKIHDKKKVASEDLFDTVKLQSWFKGGKERYWVVDESHQSGQPGQSRVSHASQADDGHDDDDNDHDGNDDGDDGDESQEEIDDQIVRDIEEWKSQSKERRLTLLRKAPAIEADAWLQFTQWNEVLSQSKHDMIKTHRFTREPDPDEPELARVARAWRRILERCLDTLAASDHKDTLKWWKSPKNEVADQHPFELPQNARTMTKYSAIFEQGLCYMFRTAPADWGEESETGVHFTEEQWKSIKKIRIMLQIEAPEDEFTDEREQDQELTTELMRFCMLIVMQDMSKITVYDSPLMHFLAVMGVDAQTKTLRSSFYYTKFLAAVLYINRLIMLEVAVPAEAWPMLQSRDDVPDVPKRIHEIRRRHLCEGSFSPTSCILSQLAMGKAFNKMHKSAPNIHWSEDQQTIFYEGEGVQLKKFEKMCHEVNKELREMLKWLMFDGDVPDIDLSQVTDSMAWSQEFRRDEYSFIQHPQNKHLDVGYQGLLKRARKARGKRQIMKKGISGQDEWIKHRVEAYLTREKKFLRKAMVGCHIQYGQPARGPELGSVKVSNSIYSARNLYVINGRLCILTMYDKARKRRGNTEYIVRYLPDEMSQILVQYMVHVRPFARPLDQRESEYLFGDSRGPWAGEELSRALSATTDKQLGVRLPVSSYRQTAVGIAECHIIRASKSWEKDDEEDDEEVQFAEGDDEEELEVNAFQHAVVRQSSHGQRVARDHYAIDGQFLHRLGPELLRVFEQASVAWHELFHLKSDGVGRNEKGLSHRREASKQLVPKSEKKVKIEKGMKPENSVAFRKAIAGLQKIGYTKPQSEGQAAALELVHEPPPTSIIVLPTSSGKSALFFSVAAMAEQQTVIVVVPFAALVDDMVDRGQKAGLACEEWLNPNSCGEMQQLVVVSADRAVTGEFRHYAKGLELHGQLKHMFFDECHVAFTDISYRKGLRELWTLRYIDCPFTCLTATLMVQLEHVLRDKLLIPDARLFRRSTARRTIRYSVQDCGDEAPSVFALKAIQDLVLSVGKRGVIYVRSYTTGEIISGALKCPFYKARAHDKGELLKEWMRSCGWIVATGALGTGINIEGIVFVVHVDRPYGLTSFAQQSGRGGRGGEVSDSIVIVRVKTTSGRRRKEVLTEYTVEPVDEDAMTEFLQVKGCRRQVMAKYFDGEDRGVDCKSTDSIFCDWCKVGSYRIRVAEEVVGVEVEQTISSEVRGSEMIAARLKELVEADELVFRVMDMLKNGCVYCEFIPIDGGAKEAPHTYAECGLAAGDCMGYAGFRQWRESVEFGDDFIHCFDCGLTQKMCRKMETGESCEYMDIMLPGIYILHEQGFLIGVVECVGFQGDYSVDLWEWMKGEAEGFGTVVESHWIQTWRQACMLYLKMRKEHRGL